MVIGDSKIIDLDEHTLYNMLGKMDKLIVVEFWSPVCPTCREVAPIYEAVSHELSDEVMFCRLNTETNGTLPQSLGVVATPTFMFFCRERQIGAVAGMVNQTGLRNTIKDAIRHKEECASHSKKIIYELDGYG
jgi:thioredoxin 1